MILAVLEYPVDDSADMFIIDTEKLDLTDAAQKRYCQVLTKAVEVSISHDMENTTRPGELFTYMAREWKRARVKTRPVTIAATVKIWEAMG
jgi:hypothetical protein